MPTLDERIIANAAERLKLPKGKLPGDELTRYKRYLKVETHRLHILHRAGGGGREICRGRSVMMDELLKHMMAAVKAWMPEEQQHKLPPFCLVAYGGYGRAELNPHSDIDIMILHDGKLMLRGKPIPFLERLLGEGGMVYALTDIRLKVSSSVFTISESVELARNDMATKTAYLEARLIEGDEKLFDRFLKAQNSKCVKGKEDVYCRERVEDQEARREKFGNSACMQEPNIKNGCGGLRDYQNLFWMADVKYGVRKTEDLMEQGLIGASEVKQLDAAYDFLLRVRTELHYRVEKNVDALPKALQPRIAYRLNYRNRSPSGRLEAFMRDYYQHTRTILLLTRNLEQRLALRPQPRRIPNFRRMMQQRRDEANEVKVDGFRFLNGFIYAESKRVFKEQPRRLMRVFLHAQQRGLELHPDLFQLIRESLPLANRKFLGDQHVHETFREILNERGNVGGILRMMHDTDFLGKYIPEFGKLTCLVQHEFFHQYAADEHTLMCLEELDGIWKAKKEPHKNYSEIFSDLERPYVLYLALLLHDAGKALHTGDHSDAGGKIALTVGERIGLSERRLKQLKWLVDEHLAMVRISQQRDLYDPDVIDQFAEFVESEDQLRMLTLLTVSDSLGTSRSLWNGFKDGLLLTLYHMTAMKVSGGTAFIMAEEKQKQTLRDEVRKLAPRTFADDEIDAAFDHLPDRYFHTHTAEEICRDLGLAHQFMHLQLTTGDRALEPVLYWHNEPDRGFTEFKICTWDRSGLFVKTAGALSAAGLNIHGAQIFSRADGIVVDTYEVTDADTGGLATKKAKEHAEEFLIESLSGRLEVDFAKMIVERKYIPPIYQALEDERIETVLRFDNDSSKTQTVVDVETEDRVGLLYFISNALNDLSFSIDVARISTEKGAAIDTFYISNWKGEKVTEEKDKEFMERKIRFAIKRLDKALTRRKKKAK